MEWQPIGTWVTSSNYVYTPVVTGQLFKFKHISNSTVFKSLKVVIKQSFDDDGVTTFFDSKVLNCKQEQDVILFSVPKGITNRRLGIVRVDNLVNEQWNIEIESLEIAQDGASLPINISDVIDLQTRLDNIQAELTEKANEIELHSHIVNTNNPHQVSANQIGAEVQGTAIQVVSLHEGTVNHPIATASSKGMMSGADKTKLNTIAEGATVNSSDSYLLDRSKHNGEQPINTIIGLIDSIATFVKLTTAQTIAGIKTFTNTMYLQQQLIAMGYISARNYYFNDTPLSLEIVRTLTTINNYCNDIGYFDLPSGGICVRLTLIISDSNFSLVKTYLVTSIFSSENTGWLRLIPTKEMVLIPFNNCEVDIRLIEGRTYLRTRRSGGDGNNATTVVRVEFTGKRDTLFIETYGTEIDGNVTGTY